jgi:uncharacterized protein YutD
LKKRTLSELQAREEKVIENLKIERQNLQIVQNRKNALTKNAITRRLCNHGRLLEYFLPPDKYTDGQMLLILEELFEDSKTQEMMKEFEEIDCDVSYMKLIFH